MESTACGAARIVSSTLVSGAEKDGATDASGSNPSALHVHESHPNSCGTALLMNSGCLWLKGFCAFMEHCPCCGAAQNPASGAAQNPASGAAQNPASTSSVGVAFAKEMKEV